MARHKIFNCLTKDGAQFERVSGWIERTYYYDDDVTNNPELKDYRTDENGYHYTSDNYNPENGIYCDAYRYKRHFYPVERFHLLTNPFWYQGYPEKLEAVTDKETVYLHCFDVDGDLYYPLYGEISDDGESIRFYREVRRGY